MVGEMKLVQPGRGLQSSGWCGRKGSIQLLAVAIARRNPQLHQQKYRQKICCLRLAAVGGPCYRW